MTIIGNGGRADNEPNPFPCYRPLTPHYITGSTFKPPQTFLDDADYAKALDCLVKGCNDFIVADTQGLVMIGKRRQLPQRDWWYSCGGRMKPGESILQSAARLLKRELGLTTVTAESLARRLVTVAYFDFGWEWREQQPQQHGTSDISILTAITVTDHEKSLIALNQDEERRWLPIDAIIVNTDYHPALRRGLEEYKQLHLMNRISEAVLTGGDDSAIAALTRQYVTNQRRLAVSDTHTVWTEENIANINTQ